MVSTAFLLLFTAVSCQSLSTDPEPPDPSVHLAAVLKEHLGSVITTLATTNRLEIDFIQNIQETIGPIQISEFGFISSKLTISIIRDNTDISQAANDAFWDPEFYYILYFPRSKPDSQKIFNYLWSCCYVHKVFIASRNSNQIETFDPILRAIQLNTISTIGYSNVLTTRLPDCNQTEYYAVYAGLYVASRYRNSRSFLVERLTLDAISERLNLNLKIKNNTDRSVKFGLRAENGTYLGTFKELTQQQANMSANVNFLNMHNILENLTYSTYVSAVKICIGVPKTKQIPRFVESFRSLNTTVWISIFLLYVLTAAAIIMLKYLRYSFSKSNGEVLSEINVPLTMFGICLGLPVEYTPKLHFEKFILSAILLVSFVVVSIIQSTLNAILSTPPSFYKFPNTREEFNEQKVLVWTSSQVLIDSYRAAGYTGVRFHLKTPAEQKNDLYKSNYDVGILEKVTAVVNPTGLEFLTLKVQLTQACPVQHNEAYVLPRGSPFEAPINRVLSGLVETGVMLKWQWFVYEQPYRSMHFIHKVLEVVEIKPLGLEDLGVPFYFSCWGFVMAFVAFVGEVLIAKRKLFNETLMNMLPARM